MITINPDTFAVQVLKRLSSFYGIPQWTNSISPINQLVSTILSQNTNDKNRDRAFEALIKCFPTWIAVRDAEEKEVINVIRSAGLANQKGPRIQNILRQITEQRGELNLDFLADIPVEEARQWLMDFKGIGPKTAAIILLFSFGKPAFPVDTHVFRVSKRLRLIPASMTVEQAHLYLEGLFPVDAYYPAHMNLIRLGREICHARTPDCPLCPLNELCNCYQIL